MARITYPELVGGLGAARTAVLSRYSELGGNEDLSVRSNRDAMIESLAAIEAEVELSGSRPVLLKGLRSIRRRVEAAQ
jgi:hypothetical protein